MYSMGSALHSKSTNDKPKIVQKSEIQYNAVVVWKQKLQCRHKERSNMEEEEGEGEVFAPNVEKV
jgi:hypothetical protein